MTRGTDLLGVVGFPWAEASLGDRPSCPLRQIDWMSLQWITTILFNRISGTVAHGRDGILWSYKLIPQ